ncbi:hypothetical protein V495_03095 [Pseudogymnoascus sp. VKM F-4514 (FW-929)]|nr:hypothetical protein V495_03095 [Pseudogymnoascus sp. VKM F-4514 (FW-929)]
MTEVSSTRLYLGNLPRDATKADVEAHFATHGTGTIKEIKLMNGFGFIEYEDAMDARDLSVRYNIETIYSTTPSPQHIQTPILTLPTDGSELKGDRLTVQFARGSRQRDNFAATDRTAPRPRRTPHRMQISGLPGETSWQVCPPSFFAPGFVDLSSCSRSLWTTRETSVMGHQLVV